MKRVWSTRTARDRQGSDTRALLVAAAARVFGARGYAATTIADITDEAKVSRATSYVYFASKEEIFVAVAERMRDLALAAHELPDVPSEDTWELVRRSVQGFFDIYVASAGVLRVIEHQAMVSPQIEAIWAETRERPVRRTTRFVERLVAEGRAAPPAPPRAIAEACFAVIADVAHRHRRVEDAIAICGALIGLPPPPAPRRARPRGGAAGASARSRPRREA